MLITQNTPKIRLRTRVIRKIEEISPEIFEKIFPKVPENYFFFKTLDESRFDQFSFYYILVYQNKNLVGAAPCFVVDYPLETSINGPLRKLANGIRKLFPHLFKLKVLVCGIPMGQGQIANAQLSFDVLEAIKRRMEALARKIKAPILAFKDFDQSYDTLFSTLLKDDYLKIDSLPMTRLQLNFSNFEEYLKTLNTGNRYNFRKKIKKYSSVNIEASMETHLDLQTLDEAYGLYLQTVELHDMGFEIVPKDFFRLISINMPKETKFFLWRINGELIAFTFCLASNDILLDYYIGFNYAYAYEYHLFFTKFPKILNWCFDKGIKTYEMGSTGYDGKRRLGFELFPVYIYVKIRYKFLRPFFKLLCMLLKFDNFDPELKQWKKSSFS